MELVDFLRARLEDDARAARAASPGPWRTGVRSGSFVVEGDGWTVGSVSDLDGEHIARHDPARVLAEVEAKLEVVRLAERAHDYHETFTNGFAAALEQALRLFALAYADHPDYRPEWRP